MPTKASSVKFLELVVVSHLMWVLGIDLTDIFTGHQLCLLVLLCPPCEVSRIRDRETEADPMLGGQKQHVTTQKKTRPSQTDQRTTT